MSFSDFPINRMKTPCMKDCKDRHPGCHGTCERYLESKQLYEEEREKIKREKRINNDLAEMRYSRVGKPKRWGGKRK